MNEPIEYEVGQRLWFATRSERLRPSREVTVEKVGRKWVQLSSGMRVERGQCDCDGAGYASPGTLWRSREAYERYLALRGQWIKLIQDLRWKRVPYDMTLERIEQARKLLGLP